MKKRKIDMKHFFNSLRQLIMIAMFLSIVVSCNDKWDDHYSTNESIVFDSPIAELLSSKPDASKFVEALKTTKMLKINDDTLDVSFYDFLLSDQFVTVWVPSNESMTDAEWEVFTKRGKTAKEHEMTAKRLIMNHIARYNFSLGNDNKRVVMMNGKSFQIKSSVGIDVVTYLRGTDNNPVINVACSNGIAHFLNNNAQEGKLPYLPTIYEFLTTDPRYRPLIGDFFESYTVERLDENASVASGINDEGEMVYIDSVTYKTNILISSFGYIQREDSSYIMVIPTPEGWTAQFNKLLPKFEYSPKIAGADSLGRLYSHVAMISDAVFNRNLQKSPIDSVCSTQYRYYRLGIEKEYLDLYRYYSPYNPNTGLFYKGLADTVLCSNGVIYITDNWNFDEYSTYNLTQINDISESSAGISVEPEEENGLGTLYSEEYNVNSSDNFVMKVQGNPFTLKWAFMYNVRSVLKGDYILKLVVVHNPDDIKDNRPLRIHPIVYFYEDGNVFNTATNNKKKLVDEMNGRYPKYYPTSTTAVASARDTIVIDKVISVPYCTYGQKEGSLQIRIENGVTTPTLNSKYNPFMYLDRIILEPVKE